MVSSSKKLTKSLPLSFSTKGKKFRDSDLVWIFLKIGPNWKYFRRISHLYQFSFFFAENVCFRTLPYERHCSTFLWKTFGQNQVVHGKFNGSNPPSSQMYNWRKKRQKICKTPLCLSGPNWRILLVQNLILYHEN